MFITQIAMKSSLRSQKNQRGGTWSRDYLCQALQVRSQTIQRLKTKNLRVADDHLLNAAVKQQQ